ncbi:MAG: hypothetical protein LBU64_01060 [Planctomycetota bacterium]|nr:hypothetical protein [Planctomycetota bacterium]
MIADKAARAVLAGLAAALFSGWAAGAASGDGSARVLRNTAAGCVTAIFVAAQPGDSPFPDGMARAALHALGTGPGSLAVFHWSRQREAGEWIGEQLAARRNSGYPLRLILAGHGEGGGVAGDLAQSILAAEAEAELVLLLTVDAIKTGRIQAAAGAAGNAIALGLPVAVPNFLAYDSPPLPDGRRFWRHVNYYQDRDRLRRGMPLPGAENHLLGDRGGYPGHDNLADFALPLLAADFRIALERGWR